MFPLVHHYQTRHLLTITFARSKPKTYLVPERERTGPSSVGPLSMLWALIQLSDKDIIEKCGLDAYFFLRYLKTLLVIFVPIAIIVIPILIPLNYIDGRSLELLATANHSNTGRKVTGLDSLAWGNIKAENTERYWVHLILALLVTGWVCTVFFLELRVYINIRQHYLTRAEHRLRTSATTVLVNSVPSKWLSEDALRGLFDVFPGGVRNIWLNRDLGVLLTKIHERNRIHYMLENAETKLIRAAKRRHLKERNHKGKHESREHCQKSLSKEDRERRDEEEDERAKSMADAGHGLSSGCRDGLPHDFSDILSKDYYRHDKKMHVLGLKGSLGSSLAKFARGFRGSVDKASNGTKTLGQEVDAILETTNGLVPITGSGFSSSSQPGKRLQVANNAIPIQREREPELPLSSNTVQEVTIGETYLEKDVKIWQFWKSPIGGHVSPTPKSNEKRHGSTAPKTSTWQRVKTALTRRRTSIRRDGHYKPYWNKTLSECSERDGTSVWARWLKPKDRPTHRLANFSTLGFSISLPLLNKKVDTIDWCRKELARLNMEICEDQKHPERYPLMTSAFVQFNHQIAAHMACQSLIHHIPRQMAPREVEISPDDVIWNNMAITWWQTWIRTAIVVVAVMAMLILWTIPVAFTASLGQLDSLVRRFQWLDFLNRDPLVERLAQVVAGVLPAALLSLLLILIPIILGTLAEFKGVKTGSQKTEFVQLYFFAFLFFQVFLVISITSFFAASVDILFTNLSELDVNAIIKLLGDNLPQAANYFFSYMILQALSTSSGTLLQVGSLLAWFVLARILDNTARNKWSRDTDLSDIEWGSFFPVYTNFACISLVYVIVAPLISVFAIITFSLLWITQRYSMLYVKRIKHDTGGVLYPRAINQTFTGLYVMELALACLFFLVRDEKGNNTCLAQSIIMLITFALTILYQILLNWSFGPLFRYLPVTFEDEACLRDEAFSRARARQIDPSGAYENEQSDEECGCPELVRRLTQENCVESKIRLNKNQESHLELLGSVKKTRPAQHDGSEATLAMSRDEQSSNSAGEYRQLNRQKATIRRSINEALYGVCSDEIEDLTPDERDVLARYAFQHEALRARRPAVWIPRDDIGVSDDEIRRTRDLSEFLWISNEGTALDSKVRVLYGRPPPDLSNLDLITL